MTPLATNDSQSRKEDNFSVDSPQTSFHRTLEAFGSLDSHSTAAGNAAVSSRLPLSAVLAVLCGE